ncbi:hypothetical protein HPB51_026003 [Rhipicephalus microplus]|uniref:Uncharacterized protein n=1 Tax=Rhipicephalus microplus TaxID=6941 RepID=A0A9J6EDV3_RHIMP|nr:hypothetical protein HPB51_026003 [Rhipicephalus microplus]
MSLHAVDQQVSMTMEKYMAKALETALPSAQIDMLYFQSVLVRLCDAIYAVEGDGISGGVDEGFIYFISGTLCINTLLGEKGDGLLERCIVAGVRPYEIVLAHVCSLSFVVVAQDLLLLFVGFVVFELPSRGPLYGVIIIAIMQGMCGMALGILWPLEGIPKFIRYFSYTMPLTLPADALRSVMSKGWGLMHPNVLSGLLVNTGWTIFFIVSCMLLFRQ